MPKDKVGSNEGKNGDDLLVKSIISHVVGSINTENEDVHQEESTHMNESIRENIDDENADGEDNANDAQKDGKNAGSEKGKSLMKSLAMMVEPTSKKKNNEDEGISFADYSSQKSQSSDFLSTVKVLRAKFSRGRDENISTRDMKEILKKMTVDDDESKQNFKKLMTFYIIKHILICGNNGIIPNKDWWWIADLDACHSVNWAKVIEDHLHKSLKEAKSWHEKHDDSKQHTFTGAAPVFEAILYDRILALQPKQWGDMEPSIQKWKSQRGDNNKWAESIFRNLRSCDVPRQDNGFDCGIFVLLYIEHFIKIAPERMKVEDLEMFNKNWFKAQEACAMRIGQWSKMDEVANKRKEVDDDGVLYAEGLENPLPELGEAVENPLPDSLPELGEAVENPLPDSAMTIDKSWTKLRNRTSKDFITGLHNFINIARNHVNSEGKACCPCKRCVNRNREDMDTIIAHVQQYGFLQAYVTWVHHGERYANEAEVAAIYSKKPRIEEEIGEMFDVYDDLREELITNVDEDGTGLDPKFDALFDELKTEIYPSCTWMSSLNFVAKMMHMKAANKWTNSSFNQLLEFLRSVLPKGNHVPESYYDCKKKLRKIGLGYESIHNCPVCNDNLFKDEKYVKRSSVNKANRAKQLFPGLQGSKSISSQRYDQIQKTGKFSYVETWAKNHSRKGVFVNKHAAETYEKIDQARTDLQCERGTEEVDELEILGRGLGERSGYILGVGRKLKHASPILATSSYMPEPQTSKKKYEELEERSRRQEEEMERMRQEMAEMRALFLRGHSGGESSTPNGSNTNPSSQNDDHEDEDE
ncbi:hypothetical protein SSX86_019801 [Deinandra increscens subsp. villosa]|uniref:Ubiquitin-like protease family profile domain-containing protein n=1 Tax=Deinandra increscens subsp. villosa TaxID=3103831 RepID=A0AAP0CXS8_9ASTR